MIRYLYLIARFDELFRILKLEIFVSTWYVLASTSTRRTIIFVSFSFLSIFFFFSSSNIEKSIRTGQNPLSAIFKRSSKIRNSTSVVETKGWWILVYVFCPSCPLAGEERNKRKEGKKSARNSGDIAWIVLSDKIAFQTICLHNSATSSNRRKNENESGWRLVHRHNPDGAWTGIRNENI